MNETLKFFRMKKKMSQEELYGNKSKASKIENGHQPLKTSELEPLLERLGITFGEFISFYTNPENNLVSAVKAFTNNPDDIQAKKFILKKHTQFSKNIKGLTSKDLGSYIGIKGTFAYKGNEISPLTFEEIIYCFNYLTEKDYHFYYDYLTAVNISIYLNFSQRIELMNVLFPIKNYNQRDKETIHLSDTLFLNVITVTIYDQKYKEALDIIEMAKQTQNYKESNNYFFSLSLQYMENLAKYKLTDDKHYYDKKIYYDNISNFIELVKGIGDKVTADGLQEESYLVMHQPEKLLKRRAGAIPTTYVKE